jgi:hypothetical protein
LCLLHCPSHPGCQFFLQGGEPNALGAACRTISRRELSLRTAPANGQRAIYSTDLCIPAWSSASRQTALRILNPESARDTTETVPPRDRNSLMIRTAVTVLPCLHRTQSVSVACGGYDFDSAGVANTVKLCVVHPPLYDTRKVEVFPSIEAPSMLTGSVGQLYLALGRMTTPD